jgi:hypothetical protein
MIIRPCLDKIPRLLIRTTIFITLLDLISTFDDFMFSSDRIYLFLAPASRVKQARILGDSSTGSTKGQMFPERIGNCTGNCTF